MYHVRNVTAKRASSGWTGHMKALLLARLWPVLGEAESWTQEQDIADLRLLSKNAQIETIGSDTFSVLEPVTRTWVLE